MVLVVLVVLRCRGGRCVGCGSVCVGVLMWRERSCVDALLVVVLVVLVVLVVVRCWSCWWCRWSWCDALLKYSSDTLSRRGRSPRPRCCFVLCFPSD